MNYKIVSNQSEIPNIDKENLVYGQKLQDVFSVNPVRESAISQLKSWGQEYGTALFHVDIDLAQCLIGNGGIPDNLNIRVYTVNDEKTASQLAGNGVNCFFTDNQALLTRSGFTEKAISHRGRTQMPKKGTFFTEEENTLLAFDHILNHTEASGIELDMRKINTSESSIPCGVYHDPYLRDKSGTAIIHNKNLIRIRDCSARKRQEENSSIPTGDQFVTWIIDNADQIEKSRFMINIEIKCDPEDYGTHIEWVSSLMSRLNKLPKKIKSLVCISSFHKTVFETIATLEENKILKDNVEIQQIIKNLEKRNKQENEDGKI